MQKRLLAMLGAVTALAGWGTTAHAFLASAAVHVGLVSALLVVAGFGGGEEEVAIVMRRGQVVIEVAYSPGQPEQEPDSLEPIVADSLEPPALPIVIQPEHASVGERRLVLAPSVLPAEREPAAGAAAAAVAARHAAETPFDLLAEIRVGERSPTPPVGADDVAPPSTWPAPNRARKSRVGPPQPAIPESLGGDPAAPGLDDASLPSLEGNAAPIYPPAAFRDRLEGATTLRLRISAQGTVAAVEVVRSSGHEVLDEAAVNAARRFRAKPARRQGQPVDRDVKIDFQFKL